MAQPTKTTSNSEFDFRIYCLVSLDDIRDQITKENYEIVNKRRKEDLLRINERRKEDLLRINERRKENDDLDAKRREKDYIRQQIIFNTCLCGKHIKLKQNRICQFYNKPMYKCEHHFCSKKHMNDPNIHKCVSYNIETEIINILRTTHYACGKLIKNSSSVIYKKRINPCLICNTAFCCKEHRKKYSMNKPNKTYIHSYCPCFNKFMYDKYLKIIFIRDIYHIVLTYL
jgi:hypothetical protein